MIQALLLDRLTEIYPKHIGALRASLSSVSGRAFPLQRIVDTNLLFIDEIIREGVSVVEVGSLIDQLGYAQLTGGCVNVKSLYSALARARLSLLARTTPPSVAAPTAAGGATGNKRFSDVRSDEAHKPVETVDRVSLEFRSAHDTLIGPSDSTAGDTYFTAPNPDKEAAASKKNSPLHSQLAKAVNILARKEYDNE